MVASLKPLSRLLSVAHVHIHAFTFIALESLTPGNVDTCWNKRSTCAVEVQVAIPSVQGDTAESHACASNMKQMGREDDTLVLKKRIWSSGKGAEWMETPLRSSMLSFESCYYHQDRGGWREA